MVTGLRSAPQADIGVVMETRVGARPHIPAWDYADPYDDSYAPAPHDLYGAAAGFPRDNYPDLRPARTRDDLTHQEWPRLEINGKGTGDVAIHSRTLSRWTAQRRRDCRAIQDGLYSAKYYRELVVKMRAERDEGRRRVRQLESVQSRVGFRAFMGLIYTTLESAEDGGNGAEEPAAKRARRS
jgi:hypothetical protein